MRVFFSILLLIFLSHTLHSAEVHWSKRLNGPSVIGGSLAMQDAEFADLNASLFTDVSSVSYLRLGLSKKLDKLRKKLDKLEDSKPMPPASNVFKNIRVFSLSAWHPHIFSRSNLARHS